MKYYLFRQPYYALVKATNEKEALKLYEKEVSEHEGFYAFVKLSKEEAFEGIKKTQCGNVEEALEILKYFHGTEKGAVIIDSSLV